MLKGISKNLSSNSSCKHVGFNHPEIEHRYQKKVIPSNIFSNLVDLGYQFLQKIHRLIHTVDGSEIPNNHLGFLETPLKPCKKCAKSTNLNWWIQDFWTINSTYLPSTFTSAFAPSFAFGLLSGSTGSKNLGPPCGEALGRMSIWNFACIVGLRGPTKNPKIQVCIKIKLQISYQKKGKMILSKKHQKTLLW